MFTDLTSRSLWHTMLVHSANSGSGCGMIKYSSQRDVVLLNPPPPPSPTKSAVASVTPAIEP